ncbi:MAG: DUF3631 domain-containing protein [Actinomycetes bacterium]
MSEYLRVKGLVQGAALLGEVEQCLRRFVVFPSEQAVVAVTLWIAATHAQSAWEHATRLALISPEKRCGKSRLLDIILALVHCALITVNISPAALVRSIGDDPPTLLVDEADTLFGGRAADNHEDLRGILNAGHQRNRPYIRWDATSRTTEACATFAMAALAAIHDLPDTVMDRAVVVRMRRRAPHETIRPFRVRRDTPSLHGLRDELAEWMHGHLDELRQAEPVLPVEDRAGDCWEPLIAVADCAGGEWPARARQAAMRLVGDEAEADAEASRGARLLADIRDLFEQMTVDFLPSQELANRLCKLDDAPWRDFELTTSGLASRLRPYGIRPRHNSAGSARGYRREDFADAFARYAPRTPRQNPSTRKNSRSEPDTPQPSDGLGRQTQNGRQTLTSDSDGLTASDVPPRRTRR